MFQEWLKRYEEIKKDKVEINYCPMCGRKLSEEKIRWKKKSNTKKW